MAFPSIDALASVSSSAETHRELNGYNQWRLCPALPTGVDDETADKEGEYRNCELRFVEEERAHVRERAAAAPLEAKAFVAWYEHLEKDGPGQHDRLFDWLETDASLPEMTWFLRQEVAGEAGFDDLVALTQVKMPTRVKLELARNYWDEMGRGREEAMHGPMLSRLAVELGIGKPDPREVVTEALALGNLLVALAANRRYSYQSLGALGVIELTAPGRAAKVSAGLRRLGVGGEARRYFALHATLDIKHSEAWNQEIIGPLVAADPRMARPIAEGALMRLTAGARCFERYRREFGL